MVASFGIKRKVRSIISTFCPVCVHLNKKKYIKGIIIIFTRKKKRRETLKKYSRNASWLSSGNENKQHRYLIVQVKRFPLWVLQAIWALLNLSSTVFLASVCRQVGDVKDLLLCLSLFSLNEGLTCLEVKTAGSGSKFSVEALKTLSDDSLLSCLLFLGKDPLGYEEGRYIWMRFLKIHQGDISNIPEGELQQLGWITRSMPPKDIKNLTLSDIDTIASFGQYHNLTQLQLQALAERVREDWTAKEPSDYTFYDLMALNHILCGFNTTYIGMIHPDSYKEAANVLSTLQDCPAEPLEALASLAISFNAFDDPSTWRSSQAKSVGCVLNGMSSDAIASIPPEGIESLTPDVVPCLLKETLRAMTIWQLKHLTPSAASAISPAQKSFLNFEQQKSVDEAIAGKIGIKNSNFDPSLRPTPLTVLILGACLLETMEVP